VVSDTDQVILVEFDCVETQPDFAISNARKACEFAGEIAVWSAVAVVGVMFIPVAEHFWSEQPAHQSISDNDATNMSPCFDLLCITTRLIQARTTRKSYKILVSKKQGSTVNTLNGSGPNMSRGSGLEHLKDRVVLYYFRGQLSRGLAEAR
jgi:hypothetical protein